MSDVVVEPYNACFSLTRLLDSASMVFAFDNESLYNLCFKVLKLASPTYSDINDLIALIMSSQMCSLRFPG